MKNNLAIPIAIVIAGVLIAVALFFAAQSTSNAPENSSTDTNGAENVPRISDDDHVLGNPDAPITIIEYSDIECPFCKQFHVTMQQIMNEYGESGQVAWVYRHFPLSQLHPNAPRLAEASECVAELSGEDAFWDFLDEVFSVAPGNNRFPMNRLSEVATSVGVEETAFNQCLDSGKYRDTVSEEFDQAIAAGGKGTPFNVIVTSGGQVVPLPGAQPYATVRSVIETILQETGQTQTAE